MTLEQRRLAALCQIQAAKKWNLAQKYREVIEAADYRAPGMKYGPFGNARDPFPNNGWYYAPRVRKERIKAELAARDLYAQARVLMGIGAEEETVMLVEVGWV